MGSYYYTYSLIFLSNGTKYLIGYYLFSLNLSLILRYLLHALFVLKGPFK